VFGIILVSCKHQEFFNPVSGKEQSMSNAVVGEQSKSTYQCLEFSNDCDFQFDIYLWLLHLKLL
jgi:hypothetical protein